MTDQLNKYCTTIVIQIIYTTAVRRIGNCVSLVMETLTRKYFDNNHLMAFRPKRRFSYEPCSISIIQNSLEEISGTRLWSTSWWHLQGDMYYFPKGYIYYIYYYILYTRESIEQRSINTHLYTYRRFKKDRKSRMYCSWRDGEMSQHVKSTIVFGSVPWRYLACDSHETFCDNVKTCTGWLLFPVNWLLCAYILNLKKSCNIFDNEPKLLGIHFYFQKLFWRVLRGFGQSEECITRFTIICIFFHLL